MNPSFHNLFQFPDPLTRPNSTIFFSRWFEEEESWAEERRERGKGRGVRDRERQDSWPEIFSKELAKRKEKVETRSQWPKTLDWTKNYPFFTTTYPLRRPSFQPAIAIILRMVLVVILLLSMGPTKRSMRMKLTDRHPPWSDPLLNVGLCFFNTS